MEEMRAARRRYWTPEEDEQLIQCVNSTINEGNANWSAIARSLGIGRSGSSCSQRYKNHLAPGLVHGDFTEEEIDKIKTLMATHGKKWAFIASRLPGRTANAVKNWYHKQLAKDLKQALGEGPSTVGVSLGGDAPPEHPAGGPTVGADGFGGFNHQFVNGADDFGGYNNGAGDGFGGFNQPFVNGGDGFGGFNQPFDVNSGFGGFDHHFVNGGDGFWGFNQPFDVNSGFGGFDQQFVNGGGDAGFGAAAAVDEVDEILNNWTFSGSPGPA